MSAVLPFYNEQSTHHVLSMSLSLQWVSTAIEEKLVIESFKKLIESQAFSRYEISNCVSNLNAQFKLGC